MFWWNMKDPPIDQVQATKTFIELDKNLMKSGNRLYALNQDDTQPSKVLRSWK